MTDLPYHKSLRLENFTAFADASFEFVPGINVFVGENGTGKTHVMKAMYGAQLIGSGAGKEIYETLEDLFQTRDIADLIRLGSKLGYSRAGGDFGGQQWSFAVSGGKERGIAESRLTRSVERPVFIPAIDMMGHTKAFLAAANLVVLDFDLTCTDLVALMGLQRRNGAQPADLSELLASRLGGTLEYDEVDGRFYLVTPLGRMPMPMVAEGLRKVATLVRLLQMGWLSPGTTLFWDEPEVNINPKLMYDLIGVILALARRGVQVFLATHSYVILKELDLQATGDDKIRFFNLHGRKLGTKVSWADTLSELEPNPILQHYGSLFDRDMRRAVKAERARG